MNGNNFIYKSKLGYINKDGVKDDLPEVSFVLDSEEDDNGVYEQYSYFIKQNDIVIKVITDKNQTKLYFVVYNLKTKTKNMYILPNEKCQPFNIDDFSSLGIKLPKEEKKPSENPDDGLPF